MTVIQLVLGIGAVFASGIMAHMYRVTGENRDMMLSALGFFSGTLVLLNLFGKVL